MKHSYLTLGLAPVIAIGLPALAAQSPTKPAPPSVKVFATVPAPQSEWWVMPSMPQMPELSKKTNEILALRSLLQSGITRKDISAALPVLKKLRDAEKSLRTSAERMLDEEKRALLAAEPGDPPVPLVGNKIREETEKYRKTERDAWKSLGEAIGRQKAIAIQMLAGSGGFANVRFGVEGQGLNPLLPPQSPFMSKPLPNVKPPAGRGENDGQSPFGLSPMPNFPSAVFMTSTPAVDPLVPWPANPVPPMGPASPDPLVATFVAQGGTAVSQGPFGGQTRPAPTTSRLGPQDVFLGPVPNGKGLSVWTQNQWPVALVSTHLTLGELIDLLEQKLSASKR